MANHRVESSTAIEVAATVFGVYRYAVFSWEKEKMRFNISVHPGKNGDTLSTIPVLLKWDCVERKFYGDNEGRRVDAARLVIDAMLDAVR